MGDGRAQSRIQAIAGEWVRSLAHHDRQASVHLARPLLVDESVEESTYRLFTCALARQLRRWPKSAQMIDQADVVLMMGSAAHELLAERTEGDLDSP